MKTAYFGGRVYTGDLPLREAFVAEDGVFVLAGSNEEAEALLSPGDERVDLEGAFVCPGFNDSHMHLLNLGASLRGARLSGHTAGLEDMLSHLRAFLAAHPCREGQWLLGRGWNQDLFRDVQRMPDRHDLDRVSKDVPIMVTRACGHACVLNSRALALSGIGPDTEAPEGGAIGREGGVPDGRLYDNAMDLALAALPVPDKREVRDMLKSACAEVNRYGITSVQTDDYRAFPGLAWQTVNEVYREMAERGELTVRVCEQAQFTSLQEINDFIAAGNKTGTGDRMFRIGPVKLLGDGSLGSRTAHLSIPYADAPDTRGFSLYPREDMEAMVMAAHTGGMQLAVHAIGDACLDEVLCALERALRACPRADHRHGIVHCQITRPEQLLRIRDLGLHVYAQSVFLDYDVHIVQSRAGEELAASSYHWKTLKDMGVSVSNGSDCPVEKPDVMTGIRCAVTRTALDGTGPYLPEEAFTVKEALDSFTRCSAEASFEENIKGRIAPGCLADFTLLSEDPFKADPLRLNEIKVIGCYLGGKRLHDTF